MSRVLRPDGDARFIFVRNRTDRPVSFTVEPPTVAEIEQGVDLTPFIAEMTSFDIVRARQANLRAEIERRTAEWLRLWRHTLRDAARMDDNTAQGAQVGTTPSRHPYLSQTHIGDENVNAYHVEMYLPDVGYFEGEGTARRRPGDRRDAGLGKRLAAARAVADLAERMLAVAEADVARQGPNALDVAEAAEQARLAKNLRKLFESTPQIVPNGDGWARLMADLTGVPVENIRVDEIVSVKGHVGEPTPPPTDDEIERPWLTDGRHDEAVFGRGLSDALATAEAARQFEADQPARRRRLRDIVIDGITGRH